MEKLTHKNHLERHGRCILLLMIVMIIAFLNITLVLGLEFDNVRGDLIIDETTSKYGKVEIKDWFGLLDLATLELKENTDACALDDCSMRTKIKMYQDGILIDSVRYKQRDWDGTWHDIELEDQFYIATSGGEWEVEDYEKVCSASKNLYPNGTAITTCKQVKTGTTHTEDNYIWEEYELGTGVVEGDYYVELRATRPSPKHIDWIITSQGKELDFWYTWGQFITQWAIAEVSTSYGIAWNGTYFYIWDSTAKDWSLYDFDGNYHSTVTRAGAQDGNQLVAIGDTMYMMNSAGSISSYDMNGGTETFICTIDDSGHIGLTSNGTSFWTANEGNNDIYQTDMACNIQTQVDVGGDPQGISMNGSTLFWSNDVAHTLVRGDFEVNILGSVSTHAGNQFSFGQEYVDTGTNGSYIFLTDYDDSIVYVYFNAPTVFISEVNTTLNSPIPNYNSTTNAMTFNCSGNTTAPNGEVMTNISLWLNQTGTWILNETAVASGTTFFKEFTKNVPDGVNYEWTCNSYDDSNMFDWATNRTFTVDTTPPQLFASITNPVIFTTGGDVRVQYNVTDITLQSCWYNFNGANASFPCASGINNFTNITSVSPATDIIIYVNDSVGFQNSTLINFTYDVGIPEIIINLPNRTEEFGFEDMEEELNWSIVHDNFAFVWYNYNGTNYTLDSAINKSIFYLEIPPFNLTFWANDTIGNQNKTLWQWNYTLFMTNESYPHSIQEGALGTFYINITNIQTSLTPYLIYNKTNYIGSCNQSGSDFICSREITIPTVNIDLNHTFYWSFLMADLSVINSTSHGITATNFKVDNCTLNNIEIMNFLLREEENNSLISIPTVPSPVVEIELEIFALNGLSIATYNNTWLNDSNISICINASLTDERYKIDLTSSFSAPNHVTEFYFMDQEDLNASLVPIVVNLMDLLTADSTSFLFNFFDLDGLVVENIIVHTFRKYVGEGLFREVERSKQNEDGNTIVHLVEEDVIYFFQITQNSTLLFTSQTYTALCDATPCTIQIEEGGGFADFSENYDLVDDGGYSMIANSMTREVNLTFVTATPSTFNLTVYKIDNEGDVEIIGSSQTTGTSGSVSVAVPQISGNVTFFGAVYQNGEFKKSQWVDFEEDAGLYFGNALAIFLGILIILCLALMGVNEGSSSIIFLILGMFLTLVLALIDYRTSIGVNILVYLILAGGLILWKVTKRKR